MAKKIPKRSSKNPAQEELVLASPTKAFFVKMLTRDITLLDSILDLLDNCVDGIIRARKTKEPKSAAKPYSGYKATITATADEFVIKDNCGGIPKELARTVAFRLGRPPDVPLEQLETVGVYGIGMKRAIFKMGYHATVTSEHAGERFRVEIPSEWMINSEDWNLKMVDEPATGKSGTEIRITELYPEISRNFSDDASSFLSNLHKEISNLFAVIMGKGFQVALNGKALKPQPLNVLMSKDTGDDSPAINPFYFEGQYGAVSACVVIGFYRGPKSGTDDDDDDDDDDNDDDADTQQAGWSIICNDRLVLRGDKSATTGWGTSGHPKWHPQYNSIAGIVTFRSADPSLLPLNTTKRGVEITSDVYFQVLDIMRQGAKLFIDFTNKWKNYKDTTKHQFEIATSVPAAEIPRALPQGKYRIVTNSDGEHTGKKFSPKLPLPPKDLPQTQQIRFTKPIRDIQFLAKALLDDETATAHAVGAACFDQQLTAHKKGRKR